jgi:formiminoglutamase
MEPFTMDKFVIYSPVTLLQWVNKRDGEQKLGEHIQTISDLADLKHAAPKFVLLGIPEDIGIRANFGIAGAKTAWSASLKDLLNMQHNPFLQGEEILLLGHFEIEEPQETDVSALRRKTAAIDALVHPVIEQIVAAGKVPIVIGGGHNNAYPIIKGTSIALKQQLNVVNIDAHADLRDPAEGRHSGNGFSMAISEGFLNNYRIFGMQQNYAYQNSIAQFRNSAKLSAFYMEELLTSCQSVDKNFVDFIDSLQAPIGLEIDLDSIQHVLSSAQSSSGFSLNEIRKILIANQTLFRYLHICEGATALADGRKDLSTGKTIAYLVCDFIKALRPHIYPQP